MTTLREKLAALRLQIRAAESQRDVWRAAGSQEKYLEAYSMVEALEAQLSSLEKSTSIGYDGRSYHYRGFRYDRFLDAVNYARLDGARGGEAPADGTAMDRVPLPTDAERTLMQALAITFEDGTYRWGEYRYDRLGDAVAYATLQAGR